MTENLSFEKVRYNGVVTVIADQIKQISNLEKKYKALILEFVKDLEKLESHRLFGKDADLYPKMVKIIKKWKEKLK